MTFNRFAPFVLAAALAAGCQSQPEPYAPLPEPEAADTSSESTAELLEKTVKTSDISAGRKDPAKTVGYGPGSTEVGERLMDGALIVDHVTRRDADNHFGVTVTLFNNKDDGAAVFEWRIAFYNEQGAEVRGLNAEWKSKAIGAKQWGSVENAALVRGAVRFKVEARAPQAPETPPPQQ
jgi:hypothetical protein